MENKVDEIKYNDKDSKSIIRLTGLMFILSLFVANLLCIKGSALPWLDTDSQWIGFLGSFLSSITTIVGIYWTIKYSRKQSEDDREYSRKQSHLDRDHAEESAAEERRFQHIPYLKTTLEDIGKSQLIYENKNIVQISHDNDYVVIKNLHFVNIGIGPMIDFWVDIEVNTTNSNDSYEFLHYPVLDIREEKIEVVEFRMKDIYKDCILKISYYDLFGNTYKQSIKIDFIPGVKNQYDLFTYISSTSEVEFIKRKNTSAESILHNK